MIDQSLDNMHLWVRCKAYRVRDNCGHGTARLTHRLWWMPWLQLLWCAVRNQQALSHKKLYQ